MGFFAVSCRSSGWAGLLEEVEMDIKRLARRNLGRDDRYDTVSQYCIAGNFGKGF